MTTPNYSLSRAKEFKKTDWSEILEVASAVTSGGTWQIRWKTYSFYDGKCVHFAATTLHDWETPDDQSLKNFLRFLTFDCEIRSGIKP